MRSMDSFRTKLLPGLLCRLLHMLARSAQRIYGKIQVPALSYPDLAEASLAVGPWDNMRKYSKCFRYLVDLTITMDLFGACCVYQVVIARTIKQLVEGTDLTTDSAVGSSPAIRIYIIALLLPCILLCMITSLKYLAPFSIVADFFILIVTVATVYYGTKHATVSPLEMPVFKTVPGLFEFIGVCVFSMEGVGATMAIENTMTEPKKVTAVLLGGMGVVMVLVMAVGFFGYWGYGELSKSPVTLNFPWEPFPIALKVFMGLMIYVTFALNFWVPFDLVWYYLKKRHQPQKYWLWERVYRIIFVTGITLIAVTFPNISKLTALIGSFCLSSMGFMYPAFIELTLDWTDPGLGFLMWRMWKCIIVALFGAVICVVGTYTNARALVHEVFK
ncbi:proton-coupled amino acid transporter-like protein pathetic isoform X2 [Bombyx mori]|uniref:Amino acid transporter transmembrane domain-containing protein n=1 Tax=Bombyx mori TaxID=7091 RepID=A0A8R2M736_BOMMO|nr:proton-coupled amino acid transporter-like protein pathetic isoform X2 [Bombyx mori]